MIASVMRRVISPKCLAIAACEDVSFKKNVLSSTMALHGGGNQDLRMSLASIGNRRWSDSDRTHPMPCNQIPDPHLQPA